MPVKKYVVKPPIFDVNEQFYHSTYTKTQKNQLCDALNRD